MGKSERKILLLLAILITAAVSCFLLFSCNIDDVKSISIAPAEVNVRIGEFNYSDYTVTATYDSGKTVEAVLTEEMIAPRDRLKFFSEGEYEIEVSYLHKTATLKVKVRRNVFAGAEFNDLDVVYNGDFYTVEVKNVPEGTTVSYPSTNRFRNAGEYQATAILRKDSYEMKEMTAKVTIRKADYDLSGVAFEGKTEDYDGTAHLLEMTGTFPAGLYVDYTITREGGREEKGNTAKNAGIYRVEARFTGDFVNYNTIESRQATLVIRQAVIDVSELKFEDKTVVYDRTKQTIEIEGNLPRGVSVRYENNEHVDAGSYKASAIFTVDDIVNYAPIPDKKATLTILKADYDMSSVHFNGTKVTYDGKEKKIEIQGLLPNGISVSYASNAATDAGSYEATATFTSGNVNYNDPAPMTATLIIDKAIAPMDQIVFERRRFISRKSDKDEYPDWFWDTVLEASDSDNQSYKDYLDIYYYDPYLAAKRYVPQNIPTGLEIASVKYKETTGWVDDLSEYNGEGDGYIDESKLDHDGYYVVVVTFDGGENYVGASPIRTLIRVNTIDDYTTFDQMIYDDGWRNPETGDATGVFMDFYVGACVPWNERASITIGDVTLRCCDCNVFKEFAEGNGSVEALLSAYDAYITDSGREAFKTLANRYVDFEKQFNIEFEETTPADPKEWTYGYTFKDADESGNSAAFSAFLEAAENASVPYSDESTFSFDVEKLAYLPLTDSFDYVVISKYDGGKTANDYYNALARIFGFENTDDFFGVDKITGSLFESLLDPDFKYALGVSTEEVGKQLAAKGAIYEDDGKDAVYIIPYLLSWTDENDDMQWVYMYFFCASIDLPSTGFMSRYGVLLSDAEALFAFFDAPEQEAELYGRCQISEIPVTRLMPKTKIEMQEGVPEEKILTGCNDFDFMENSDATDHLIYDARDIYRFLKEIPGNCVERQESYDANAYVTETPQASYSFCDCDPFATVIKASGDASGVTKRYDRDDHPQMTSETAAKFDQLTELYKSFIDNYIVGEDVVNEWKIGVTNRNYAAYKAYFECATAMFAKSNRNMGKDNEYVISKSVLIGMNRAFSISVNGSGNEYSVDQYRMIVAKLFGFTDLDTFTAYVDNLAKTLAANERSANVDSVSSRLYYDGAVFTQNGYFVLPYAIKSETSLNKVLAFIFVDANGTMTIWINDARNAFNATNYGEEVWETGDKYNVTINGRCMLFEDDGYLMKEDLNGNIVYMIDNLLEYAGKMFSTEESKEACYETNSDWDYDAYRLEKENAIFYFCDCDPLTTAFNGSGDASAITNRSDRDDRAQMSAAVAEKFDALSALYQTLLSGYVPKEGDWKIVQGEAHYNEYRKLFRYARDLFASAENGWGNIGDYLMQGSAIVGLNESFTISVGGSGNDYALDEYRLMIAKLFGFADQDTFIAYASTLASTLAANARNASVDSVSARLIYDGAILTENGYFVLPYVIGNETTKERVLAFIFADAEGKISVWIHNVGSLIKTIDFTELAYEGAAKDIINVNGRCVLFESGGYAGFGFGENGKYVAVEKDKSFASPGDFLIYCPVSDEEGFEVYWFSLYAFEREVIYEDPDTDSVGTVQKGFYKMINVASIDDIRNFNQKTVREFQEGEEA